MMRSRIPDTLVIDCCTDNLGKAAAFWSAVLDKPVISHAPDGDCKYTQLQTADDEPEVLLQCVQEVRGVHVDIQTDNLDAEVLRLEKLGARRIGFVRGKSWTMAAPCGQLFCVVKSSHRGFGPHVSRRH